MQNATIFCRIQTCTMPRYSAVSSAAPDGYCAVSRYHSTQGARTRVRGRLCQDCPLSRRSLFFQEYASSKPRHILPRRPCAFGCVGASATSSEPTAPGSSHIRSAFDQSPRPEPKAPSRMAEPAPTVTNDSAGQGCLRLLRDGGSGWARGPDSENSRRPGLSGSCVLGPLGMENRPILGAGGGVSARITRSLRCEPRGPLQRANARTRAGAHTRRCSLASAYKRLLVHAVRNATMPRHDTALRENAARAAAGKCRACAKRRARNVHCQPGCAYGARAPATISKARTRVPRLHTSHALAACKHGVTREHSHARSGMVACAGIAPRRRAHLHTRARAPARKCPSHKIGRAHV